MTMTTKKQGEDPKVEVKPTAESSAKAFQADELVRLVYREVLPGDVAKFAGKSNTAPSGGGARDFRFSPYSKFQGIFEKLISGKKTEPRRRNGMSTDTLILTGKVTVTDASQVAREKTIEFEPPTTARGDEGRLPRLNAYGMSVPSGNCGRILLLLYQTGSRQLFLNFATEQELRSGVWDPTVTLHLLGCLSERRPVSHAAQGFFDLATGESYCKCSGNP